MRAVEMMARIAREVEAAITFKTYPVEGRGNAHVLSEARFGKQCVHPELGIPR